ncbi:hypothetical protein, partial [Phocaeicola vulgatus]|uniref:hypothetical protein n=1 Tax=Phocaeicola vulgatus TaxID=821 RepID=UPI001EE0CA1F
LSDQREQLENFWRQKHKEACEAWESVGDELLEARKQIDQLKKKLEAYKKVVRAAHTLGYESSPELLEALIG